MYERTKFLILILSFVGGYKLSEYENLTKSNLSDSSIGPLISDDGHTTYEALKNIHNYVYPKLYQAIDPIGYNKSSRNITLNDIGNNHFYTKLDQNHIESKHANIDFGSSENNLHMTNLMHSGGGGGGSNTNLASVLPLIDPLFLMAVLGFIAYIINAVLSLVDKLHVSTLLGPSTSPFYRIHRRQHETAMPAFDVNQHFLIDLEKIFRLAIELYENKIWIVFHQFIRFIQINWFTRNFSFFFFK